MFSNTVLLAFEIDNNHNMRVNINKKMQLSWCPSMILLIVAVEETMCPDYNNMSWS